jgi:hypothetical protein
VAIAASAEAEESIRGGFVTGEEMGHRVGVREALAFAEANTFPRVSKGANSTAELMALYARDKVARGARWEA